MAVRLRGAPVAEAVLGSLAGRVAALKMERIFPKLAIVRVGERAEAGSYEAGIRRRCETAGVSAERIALPDLCTAEELEETVQELAWDRSVHGILLLRPLPDREMEERARALMPPEKDVDGSTALSLGTVFAGEGPGFPPCTAQACMEILDFYQIPLSGRRAVVIGRSLVVGRPVSLLLQQRDATVTMCHSRTPDTADLCRDAGIVVAAAGRAGLFDASFAAPGQTVIDVGIHVGADGHLTGDVAFEEVEPIVAAITPVPGGVGAVTTAVLVKHVVEAAERTRPGS